MDKRGWCFSSITSLGGNSLNFSFYYPLKMDIIAHKALSSGNFK